MSLEDALPLALYGVIILAVVAGGIIGPKVLFAVAGGFAVLWVVILAGHRRDKNARDA